MELNAVQAWLVQHFGEWEKPVDAMSGAAGMLLYFFVIHPWLVG